MPKLVPDSMARYATYELSELLLTLTTGQREAVGRIVEHVYINNRPLGHLLDGDDKICSERTYYKRGILDTETGEFRNPGWSHQPAFTQALEMAARLALQTQESEDLHRLRKAKRRAIEKAESAVNQWVDVMEHSELDFARIQAAGEVVKLAFHNPDSDEAENHGAAGDWWQAALDE